MNNIIPKTIRKTKLEFYKGFGLIEALVIGLWVVLSALFIWGLPMGRYWRIGIIILTSFIAIPLVIPVMPGVKVWYVLILIFKYWAQPKKYLEQKNNDTSLLVPYETLVNNKYLKTYKIQGLINYVAAIQIQGFNISLLSADQQNLKVQQFHDLFKYCDFPITLMKIDLPPTNLTTINYYQNKLQQYQNDLQKGKLTTLKFEMLKSQIEDYIATLQQTNTQDNGVLPTQKQWYCFVYALTINELEERIDYLENKFINNNFPNQILSGYELIKTLRLIWNPYEPPITREQYNEFKNNINELISSQYFHHKQTHFIANDIYYNVSNIHDYPLNPINGWGANLANNEQTVIWNIHLVNREHMRKNLNRAINIVHTKKIMNRNNVDKSAISYEIQAYEALNDDINGANEIVKNVNISFLSYEFIHYF